MPNRTFQIWHKPHIKIWRYWVTSNFGCKIFSNFVCFSECPTFKIETIWITSWVLAPCVAYDSMMEIPYLCKYFNQWQHSLVMLTAALYCYWLKGTVEGLISCSWHQTTKQLLLFSPIFPQFFYQFQQLKVEKNWGKQDWWFDATNKIKFSIMMTCASMSKYQKEKHRVLICHIQSVLIGVEYRNCRGKFNQNWFTYM
jgi:hypothetical protein